ncbi:hypothetical protein GOV14_06565 [Candidatus Pacearchaeota archaeon]|nr:hypothetical protein [Candidatus Pacearchaeota archaeon]
MVDLIQFVPETVERIINLSPQDGLGFVWNLIIILVLIIISSLPLYISLKLFFARKVSIFRVFLVNMIVGFIVAIVKYYFETFGAIIAFILLLFMYKISFGIGWIRALLVWLLQFVILAILTFALALIGLSIL